MNYALGRRSFGGVVEWELGLSEAQRYIDPEYLFEQLRLAIVNLGEAHHLAKKSVRFLVHAKIRFE